MNTYTAYVLDDASRNMLAKRFPPKYPKFIGHHITVEFGVEKNTELPLDAQIKVVGYVDSGDGLEVLVTAVNNSTSRKDGKIYHITWSLDTDKYKPVDSNALLQSKRFTLVRSIPVATTPKLL